MTKLCHIQQLRVLLIIGFTILITGIPGQQLFGSTDRTGDHSPLPLVPALQASPTTPPTSRYVYQETFTDAQSRARNVASAEEIAWNLAEGTLTLANRHNLAQADPLVVTDGSAHTYVVWQDLRHDDGDIYTQRIDTNGNPLWENNRRVNRDENQAAQSAPAAAIDTKGNLLVGWVDRRNTNEQIYAQKLDATGEWLWLEDLVVSAGGAESNQGAPDLAISGDGRITLVWHDNRLGDYDIFVQQLDGNGLRQWDDDLRLNQDASLQSQVEPSISTNANGNVTVIWLDQRIGNRDVYAQQVTTNGELVWETEVRINPLTNGAINQPALVTPANGTSVIAWQTSQGEQIAIQTLLSNGQLGWSAPQLLTPNAALIDTESAVGLVATVDTILLTWLGFPSGTTTRQLYVQQLDSAGNSQSLTPMLATSQSGDFNQVRQLHPARLDDGRLLVVWPWQTQDGQQLLELQALDTASGTTRAPLWSTPRQLNDRLGTVDQRVPTLATTATGDTILIWQDYRASQPGIYAQRIDSAGTQLWGEGIRVDHQATSTGDQLLPVVGIREEAIYVAWSAALGGRARIYLQQLDLQGNRQWTTPRTVSRDTDEDISQINPTLQVGSDGTIILAWEESRDGGRQIRAQRLNSDGLPQWPTDLLVSLADTSARLPDLTIDGVGNSTVVWNVTDGGGTDLWAQKVNRDGVPQWDAPRLVNGFTGLVDRFNPVASAALPDGSTVMTWVDRRERAIYAQRLASDGTRIWNADQLLSTAPTGGAPSPDLIAISADQLVAAWQGISSNGEQTIITRTIQSATGEIAPTDSPLAPPLSAEIDDGYYPALARHTDGSVVIAWQDGRAMNPDIYLQRLSPTGESRWEREQPVVSVDRFYVETGTMQSTVIDTTAFSITHALLEADLDLAGGMVNFQLSNDDGNHWADVDLGVMHAFTTTGSALRWQVTLIGDPRQHQQTPTVDALTITYAAALEPENDLYEPDDDCRAGNRLRIDGAPQSHELNTNGVLDQDWFVLEIAAGKTYTLLVEPARYLAELSVAIYANCLSAIQQRTVLLQGGVHQITFASEQDTTYHALVTYSHATPTLPPLTYAITLHQQPVAGHGILVAGPTMGDKTLVSTAATHAYQTLLAHGYTAGTITYLATNEQSETVDAPPTMTNLHSALQSSLNAQQVTEQTPLLLYLVGEFDEGRFQMDNGDALSADILDHWLTDLETTSPLRRVSVIVEGAGSGAFQLPVSTNRLWIAGTEPNAVAWSLDGHPLFSEIFWAAMHQGYSMNRSFLFAQSQTAQCGCFSDGVATCQSPWLEDSGDGTPNGTRDGQRADNWQLGPPNTTVPQIVEVTTSVENEGSTAQRFTVRAQLLYANTLHELHAHLIQPATSPSGSEEAFSTLQSQRATLTALAAGSDVDAFDSTTTVPVITYHGTFATAPAAGSVLVITGITERGLPILPYTHTPRAEHTIFLPTVRR